LWQAGAFLMPVGKLAAENRRSRVVREQQHNRGGPGGFYKDVKARVTAVGALS